MELGWVDYSERDRQYALSVLSALKEAPAVDEIGIGIVRDAFADRFFPATSTLLTRAKYFFLVPYALRDLERKDNRGKSAAAFRRHYDDDEKKIAIDLIKESGGTAQGIFGARSLCSDFTGSWVKRGPAIAYWSPLRQLDILHRPDMGYADFFRYAAKSSGTPSGRASQEVIEAGLNDDDAARSGVWNIPGLIYDGWKNKVSIDLTNDEAVFLARQIKQELPDSLFALLLRDSSLRASALSVYRADSPEEDDPASTALAGGNAFHEFVVECGNRFPPDLKVLAHHAVAFSDFIYGCRIRYNAQLTGHEEEAASKWEAYRPGMESRADALDIEAIYALLDLGGHAGAYSLYGFLKRAKIAMSAGDIDELDNCISSRERSIKHGRAKIGRTEGVPEGWRSGSYLSYRFEVAASILSEIDDAGGCDA